MHAILRRSLPGIHEEDQEIHSLSFPAMRAMILESLGEIKPSHAPLRRVQHPDPSPAPATGHFGASGGGDCGRM